MIFSYSAIREKARLPMLYRHYFCCCQQYVIRPDNRKESEKGKAKMNRKQDYRKRSFLSIHTHDVFPFSLQYKFLDRSLIASLLLLLFSFNLLAAPNQIIHPA